jgi:hypothetical protein
VANLVYKRVSTDQQSTDRQNLVLDKAGIEDPVAFEEDGGNEQGRKWNGEQEETQDPGREVDPAVAVGELGQCSHLVEEIWVGDSPHYQLVTYGFSEHAQQQWLGNDTEAFRVTV